MILADMRLNDAMVHYLRHLLTPHHTNNHRPRLLHPAGLSVLVGIALLFQTWFHLVEVSGELPGGFVLGYATSIMTSDVVGQTNARRAEQGLPPLKQSPQLAAAAAAKAQHMFDKNYWAHIGPDGTTPWVFIRGSGYSYTVAGENLARDFMDTPAMVQAWMDSPTHRENIVNPKYSEIGIAVVNGVLEGEETTLVVQMFGNRGIVAPQLAEAGQTTQQSQPQATQQPTITEAPLSPTVEPTTVPVLAQARPDQPNALGVQAFLTVPEVQGEIRGVRISPLLIKKVFAASMMLLIGGVLAIDTVHINKSQIPRSVGKNWAHLVFLGLVLVTMLTAIPGVIK